MLSFFEPIFNGLWWVLFFYLQLSVYLMLNIFLTAGILWGLLLIFRLIGIPWIDGTRHGFGRSIDPDYVYEGYMAHGKRHGHGT